MSFSATSHASCTDELASPFVRKTAQILSKRVEYYSRDFSLPRQYFKHGILFNDSDKDLFLGFSENHVYFVFQNIRFDGGRIFDFDNRLREDYDKLSSGLLIRIRNLPARNIQMLKLGIRRFDGGFKLTCVLSVYLFLRNYGGLNFGSALPITPQYFARNLIATGVRTHQSIRLEQEVYLIGAYGRTLKEYLSQMTVLDACLDDCSQRISTF